MIRREEFEIACRYKMPANAKLLLLYSWLNPHDKKLEKASSTLKVSQRTIDRAIIMLKTKNLLPYHNT